MIILWLKFQLHFLMRKPFRIFLPLAAVSSLHMTLNKNSWKGKIL